ncbi:WD repeat and SOCS box-containing protein 1-like [Argonauta hians]
MMIIVVSVEAPLCGELRNPYPDSNVRQCNSRRIVTWADDGSYLAWSCGDGFVLVCTWDTRHNLRSLEDFHKIDCGETVCSLAFSTVPSVKKDNTTNTTTDTTNTTAVNDFSTTTTTTTTAAATTTTTTAVVNTTATATITPPHQNGNHKTPSNGHHGNNRLGLTSFDRNLVLGVGVLSGRIQLWNASNGHLMLYLRDHTKEVCSLHFAPDASQVLVSGSHDGTLKFWDLTDDGNMTHTLHMPHDSSVHSCRFTPDAQYVAATGAHRMVVIFHTSKQRRGEPVRKLRDHQNAVVSCDFSPDGALLATASHDTRVIVWDWRRGVRLRSLGHLFPPPRPIFAGGANDYYVRSVMFCRFGATISTVADDGYMRVWNLLHPSTNPACVASQKEGICCQFCPNNTTVAVGTHTGDVYFYKIPSASPPLLLHLCRTVIRASVGHPDTISLLHLPPSLNKYLSYDKW